jgi:hypothetical protein
MMGKVFKSSPPDPSRDKEREAFLLKELDLMEGEIKRLRAEGPLRLQFLFTTTSALLGSLLVLAGLKAIEPDWIRRAGIATSFLLFTFSLVTYDYLISRDISCDRNARATARIRQYFLSRSPGLSLHVSWQTIDRPTQWIRVDRSAIRRMAVFIASSVGGLSIGLTAFELARQYEIAYAVGIASGATVAFFMHLWASRRLKSAMAAALAEQRFPDPPSGA